MRLLVRYKPIVILNTNLILFQLLSFVVEIKQELYLELKLCLYRMIVRVQLGDSHKSATTSVLNMQNITAGARDSKFYSQN